MTDILFAYDQFEIRDDVATPFTHLVQGNSGTIIDVAEVVSISVDKVLDKPDFLVDNSIVRTYSIKMAYIAGGSEDVAIEITKAKLLNNQEPQEFGTIQSIRTDLLGLVAVPVDSKDRENNYFLFFGFSGIDGGNVVYTVRATKVRTLDQGSESALLLVDNITTPLLLFNHTVNSQKVGEASMVDVFYAYELV